MQGITGQLSLLGYLETAPKNKAQVILPCPQVNI
jgi:hypothetical protein